MNWRRLALMVNLGSLLVVIGGVSLMFNGMALVMGITTGVIGGAFLLLIGFWGLGMAWGWTEGYQAGRQRGVVAAFAAGRQVQQARDAGQENPGHETWEIGWQRDVLHITETTDAKEEEQ